VVWSVEQTIYIHGGFEQTTPNIPINMIATIETEKLFTNHDSLLKKVQNIESKGGAGKERRTGRQEQAN
jgi:hypothetical protein